MKAIIYARQSSGDEEDSASIEVQIQHCTEYADKQGWEYAVYSDSNTSGKTYPALEDAVALSAVDTVYQCWHKSIGSRRKLHRKGLADALKAIVVADVLLFYDFTRLMRPLTDSFLESYLKQKILASGVKVVSIQEGELDLTAFNTSLITTLQSRINDNQIAITRAKSIAGLKRNRDNGLRYSGADFLGFHNAGKQKVVEVPEELEIVRFIIKHVNAGIGIQRICRAINSHFKQRKHNFNYSDVKKVCNRLEYAGKCLNSDGDIIDSAVFPCIIPLAEMLKARERLNNRRFASRDKKDIHPLSGLVYCGVCGERLKVAKTKSFPRSLDPYSFYYTHQHYHVSTNVKADCVLSQTRIHYSAENKSGLDDIVLPLLLPAIEAELNQLNSKQDNSAEIKFKIEKIENLETFLDKKLVDGDITEAEYERRFNEYAEQKKALKKQLVTASTDNSSIIKELGEICLMLTLGESIQPHIYKRLVQQYIHKIMLYPTYIDVVFLNGTTISIEKVRMRNSRCFPSFVIHNEDKYVIEILYKNGDNSTIYEDDYIRIIKAKL